MKIRDAAVAMLVAGLMCAPAADVLADSRPDISGVWMAYGASGGGGATLSDQGRARVDEFYGNYSEVPDPGSFCVPTGMPIVMSSVAGYPIEIIQQAERITMLAEREMQVRRIYLDGRPHPDNYPSSAIGHSRGTWDGNVLYVETALLSDSLLRQWPRSGQTRIVERIELKHESQVEYNRAGFILQEPVDDAVLVVELTITDPTLYAGPQRRTVYYRRIPDDAILEYDCAMEAFIAELETRRVD
jgi:hypothetical protein